MKKILHIIPNLGFGGAEKILLSICRAFHRKVFEMGVISLKSGGAAAESLKNLGIPVILLNSPDGFLRGLTDFPRLFLSLRRRILQFSPNLIHTWLTRANVAGRLAAQSLGLKNVLSSLRVMELEKNYHLWAESLTHPFCRAVTVNSTELKKFAIEKIGIPEEKVILIFNGIELPSSPSPNHLPDSPLLRGVSEGRGVLKGEYKGVRIGTLGRLHKQKGVDIFLRAAKMVLEKFPQTVFLVGGDGEERAALEKLAAQLQISTQVHFTGAISNPAEFFQSLDIFVLASRWEGMPNVILEAMANGVPSVAARVGGVTDLIEDGASGILVEREDAASCADGILRLLADAALRKKIVENAFKRVQEKFNLNALLSGYQKLYDSLTETNGIHPLRYTSVSNGVKRKSGPETGLHIP